jgi:hypothetical protein
MITSLKTVKMKEENLMVDPKPPSSSPSLREGLFDFTVLGVE